MRPIRSPFLTLLCLLALSAIGVGSSPSAAQAQTGHIDGAVRLDLHLGLGWHGALGPGLRLDIPLSRDGLISSVNDEFALTLGADVLFHTYGHHNDSYYRRHHRHHGDLTLLFPVAVQWNFILSHGWTIFPELGFALEHNDAHLHAVPHVAFGARWHFGSGQTALLMRLAHPGAFQIGFAW